jgi:undecaprenyl pyrophosphate synthase
MKNLTGILAILMMIFIGLACSGDDTEKANALVDEANKFIVEGNKSVEQADSKLKEFDAKVDALKNEDDLKAARDFGKQLTPLYDSMKDNFQKASEKFDAASKLKLNDKFKEYLETKAAEMKKRSEYGNELKAIPKALDDAEGEKAYRDATATIVEKVQKMSKEAQELADKATKIQKDNPSIMKQN